MTTRASSLGGGRLLLGAAAAALLLLGGCVMAPVDPYYDVGTPVTSYPAPVYGPSYVAPAYPAYSAPYYYGPSMSLGIYGGWSDDHRHGRDRPRRPNWGDRDGPRPGWNGHNGPRPGWNGQPGPRPGAGDRPARPNPPYVRPPPVRSNPDWRPGAPQNRLSGVDGGG